MSGSLPRWSQLGLVFLGGTAGTAAREAITLLFPDAGPFPAAIFAINIAGAFLLGFLVEALARRGPDEGARRRARLLLGTGFCGGFTTYSALAVDSATLAGSGDLVVALPYALGTVLIGAAASFAGIAIAAARHRPGGRR